MPPLPLSNRTRLLIVAPHPDDETLGCGVLLQQVLEAGGEIRLLLMTDGDNNPWPQRYLEHRVVIDEASRRRWGERRRREVVAAIHHLGAAASILHPLGWRDMEITRRIRDDLAGSVATMRSAIQAFQPNLVCCPALRDSHPDHGAVHVLCRLALAEANLTTLLLAYPVHGAIDAMVYPFVVHAREDQQQRKLDAMAMHKTQMALSGSRMRRLAQVPEHYQRVEAFNGEGILPWRPPIFLQPWLRLLVASSSGSREWPWREAPICPDSDGRYRLRGVEGSHESGQVFAKLYLSWPSPWIFDHWGWHTL